MNSVRGTGLVHALAWTFSFILNRLSPARLRAIRGRDNSILQNVLLLVSKIRISSASMPKVTVQPSNVSAEVDSGETLLDAGEKAGVEMEAGCFNCSCGTCAVEIIQGMENLDDPSPEELDVLDA